MSFFRIPKVIYNKGDKVLELSRRRRNGYLAAISRMGLTEKILKNDRVCSKHFVSGKPTDLLDSYDYRLVSWGYPLINSNNIMLLRRSVQP